MVRRPRVWRRDVFVPIVIFTGDKQGDAESFARTGKGKVPYAKVESARADQAEVKSAGAGEFAALRKLIGEVIAEDKGLGSKVAGSLLPAPRFPLTEIVLWALQQRDDFEKSQKVEGKAQPDAKLDWADKMRERRRERSSAWSKGGSFESLVQSVGGGLEYLVRFLSAPAVGAAVVTVTLTEWLDTAGLINVGILAGAVLSALVAAGLLAGLWSSSEFRYGWFARQRYEPRRRGEQLHLYMQRIAYPESSQAEVEPLLMNALLEDLRLAYSRRHPWPGWGRGGYAVLLLTNAGANTVGRRFLTVMHEVLAVTGQKAPLLVVTSADSWPEEICGDEHPSWTSLEPVAEPSKVSPAGEPPEASPKDKRTGTYTKWLASSSRVAPCPYLVVDMGKWDKHRGFTEEGARRLVGRMRPIGYWLIVGMTVLFPLGLGGWTVLRPCEPGLSLVEGECVGVSNATKNFDPALAPILNLINKENDRIPSDAKMFKIVYFGPLTTRPGSRAPGTRVDGTFSELAGVYARQRRYNNNKNSRWLYVKFANSGEDFRHADVAARAIAERAAEDRAIAAVIGLGWSRTSVQRAIATLHGVQVPMLSTTATANRLAVFGRERSGYFYHMAALNSRQALVIARWLERGLPAALDRKVRPNPKVGILRFTNPEEIYSVDLAEAFQDRYAGESEFYDFQDPTGLKREMDRACDDGVEVLFYTGRGDQLAVLKEGWESFCAKKKVVLLAGDDMTNTALAEVARNETGHDIDLRFIALSDPAPEKKSGLRGYEGHVVKVLNEVKSELAKSVGDDQKGGLAPVVPPSHAMLAHDAALAVTTAVDRMLAASWSEATDVRAGTQEHLRGLEVTGATGELRFSAERRREDEKRSLWLYSIFPKRPHKFEMRCTPVGNVANCTSDMTEEPIGPKDDTRAGPPPATPGPSASPSNSAALPSSPS
ncbi:hypothetical protein [Sinosporangium siamense]|uniref:ABC-type branched-chain amino acid transport system, substrate-binding protein n=2 Tax=Sinosporangium siamense TaxID=1367973 RepID=A0A919RAP9_9ACTN|nr:hypothetical protein [Sinosporangium siamense]GII90433.1 hypothetical protein Ssi02_06640 [Sinosporangium siamense]